MLRWAMLFFFVVASLSPLACTSDGDDGKVDAADTATDPDAGDGDSGAVETVTPPDRCCPYGTCPPAQVCVDGACHPIPGSNGCYRDTDCDDGQVCDGSSLCSCEDESCDPAAGTCRWPDGCCNADSECAEGEVCERGICRTAPGSGACWRTEQCGSGLSCAGVEACACGDETCESKAGFCAVPGPCCASDVECGAGGICVSGGCVRAAIDGRCFADSDCTGDTSCAGASKCACSGGGCAIPTTAGKCTEGEPCCRTAADCGQGEICVDGTACVPAPGPGACYKDEHCGPGRVCEGATLCGCGEDCSEPGTCRTYPKRCTDTSDCGPGLRCAIADVSFCPGEADPELGYCVPEALPEECWSSDECDEGGERCGAEEICTDPLGCDAPDTPGTCRDFVIQGNCCVSHRECGPGFHCRNSNTSITCPPTGTAVCLPDPDFGESCWNFWDCPEGEVCNEARVCACNARCHRSHEGFCAIAKEQFCNADIDCGTDYVCARDLECIVNPCFATDNCPLAGRCQPKGPGACWGHTECADGEYCKGLRVCPSNTTCSDPDLPGVCSPLEEAGACCNSYFACAAGLRCLSVAEKSSCVLDFSSVCVPYTPFNQSCYSDEDCAENRTCKGAVLCPCGAPGCEGQQAPGTCVAR